MHWMAVWRWVQDSAHSTGYGDDELGCWLFEWELLCRSKEEGIIDGAVCCSSNRRVAASNSSVNGCLVLMNAWSWFARLVSWVAGMDMRLDATVPASGGKVHSEGRQLSDHCRLSVSGWESLLSGTESRGRTRVWLSRWRDQCSEVVEGVEVSQEWRELHYSGAEVEYSQEWRVESA